MMALVRRLLPKGGFARGALTLMTGTTVAQAIPIAISPILTRIYSPTDFGVFALFTALVVFLSTAATGRYELAVMLPKNEEDADALVILSAIIAAVCGLVLLVPALFMRDWAANALGHPEVAPWFFLLPVSVFLTGSYNALNYWLNRHKYYRRMSSNRMLQSGLGGGSQLLMGAWGLGATGLILGQLFGLLSTTAQIALSFAHSRPTWDGQSLRMRLRQLALQYISHPMQLLPAHWIGAAAMQLPVLAVSTLYGAAAVGLYALAYRIVVLPSVLIAGAIGDVYRQRASVLYLQHGSFRRLFLTTLGTTTALAVTPVAVIFIFAPALFALVFGESWRVAGEYARILAIGALFQFVFTPIDKGALIVGATLYIFVWHVIRLVSFGAVLVSGWIFDLPISQTLFLFATANAALYILDGIVGYWLAGTSTDHEA